MGLDTYDQNTPYGSTSLSQGDNKIRELAQKTCNSIEQEHTLAGYHKIPNGSLGSRPAAGIAGRLYVVNDPVSGNISLQYDNGSSWVNIGMSSESTFADDLTTHKTAAIIDHPEGSITELKLANYAVTHGKIGLGALKKKHFDSGHVDPSGSVADLINGSELSSSWHTHPAGGGGGGGITYFSSVNTIASGTSTKGWTNLDLSGEGVPVDATGVIIQGEVVFEPNNEIPQDKTPRINVRKDSISDTMWLCGGVFVHEVTAGGVTRIGMRSGACFVPVGTGTKIQYTVEDVNYSWEIKLIGYTS